MQFKPMYPDVLGAVTGGTRISMNDLQMAVGIFPKQAYLNQPVEVIIVLQSMVDQNMQVKVGVRVPTTDRKGMPVVIEVARSMVTIGLRPGEVGILRMPIVAQPPTRPGQGFPVRVAIRYRIPAPGEFVRPAYGGPPPSVLGISPFRLQALREIEFAAHTWNESAEIITAYFDVAPKSMPGSPGSLQHHYETLWAPEEIDEEVKLAQSHIEDARAIAVGLLHPTAYFNFLDTINDRFSLRGMPLHPGEAKAISKMLSYTVDEAPTLETGAQLDSMRWFQQLCQVVGRDESLLDMDRGELITTYLYNAVIFDSILLGFHVLSNRVKEDLGDASEQMHYANTVLSWLAGSGQPDLSYVYLPLVLGGLVIHPLLKLDKQENPWLMMDELREAIRGRARLAQGEAVVVFEMARDLLKEEEQRLRERRINRP